MIHTYIHYITLHTYIHIYIYIHAYIHTYIHIYICCIYIANIIYWVPNPCWDGTLCIPMQGWPCLSMFFSTPVFTRLSPRCKILNWPLGKTCMLQRCMWHGLVQRFATNKLLCTGIIWTELNNRVIWMDVLKRTLNNSDSDWVSSPTWSDPINRHQTFIVEHSKSIWEVV